jgi:hypothetical protein
MMTMHGFQVILLAVWSCWVVYLHADLYKRMLPELCSYLNSHLPVDTRELTEHEMGSNAQTDSHLTSSTEMPRKLKNLNLQRLH